MLAIRWATALLFLVAIGCGDDAGVVPDVALPSDLGVKKEASAIDGVKLDQGTIPDGMTTPDGPRPDGVTSPDGPKADGPAADGPKPDGPKPDGPKPDGPKPDAPKTDGPKPDAPKTDGPKPDAPKPDGPKPDGPKPDAPKPVDAANPCSPNPCQNGGTCAPASGGFTCTCTAGWKGTTCQTASFCDVVYRLTGSFHSTYVPLIQEFTRAVGTNATLPSFNPARTTPFTPTAFPLGFMRLRFPSLNGVPAAGSVKIVEAFIPMEFSVTTAGSTVATDIDQSAGMLTLGGTPQQIGDPPVLNRSCGTVASGTVAGTTLTWAACSAIPDNTTTWTAAKAVSNDPGCLHRMSTYGNVNCTPPGFVCNLAPGLGNQNQTWDQKLNSFTFSSTNYATATFTMAEVQAPNNTNVKTFIALTATSVLKVECDNTTPLTCDEK